MQENREPLTVSNQSGVTPGFASFDLKTGVMDSGNPGGIAFSKYHVFPFSMAPSSDGVWVTENDTNADIVKIKNDGSVIQPFEVNIQQARILEASNKLFIVTAGSEGTYDGQKYQKYFSIDLKNGRYAPWEISFSPGGSTYGGIYDAYSSNVANRLYVGCGEAYDTTSGKSFKVIPQGSYGGMPVELQDKLFCFNIDTGKVNLYSKINLDLISTITLNSSFSNPDFLQIGNNQIYGFSQWNVFEISVSK